MAHGKKKTFDPQITRVALDIEQAVLSCCKHCPCRGGHGVYGAGCDSCYGGGCYHVSGSSDSGSS